MCCICWNSKRRTSKKIFIQLDRSINCDYLNRSKNSRLLEVKSLRANRTIQILGMRAAATATANSAQTQTALAHTAARTMRGARRMTIATRTANSAQTPTARMHAPAQTMMTARRKQKQRQRWQTSREMHRMCCETVSWTWTNEMQFFCWQNEMNRFFFTFAMKLCNEIKGMTW